MSNRLLDPGLSPGPFGPPAGVGPQLDACMQHSKNGEQFEARQLNGRAYIRLVAS